MQAKIYKRVCEFCGTGRSVMSWKTDTGSKIWAHPTCYFDRFDVVVGKNCRDLKVTKRAAVPATL